MVKKLWLTGYHAKESLCEFDLKSFPENILEFHALLHEFRLDVTPGKVIVIQQVDHYVHNRFHIVSSRLIVTPTGIEGGKEEISRKFPHILLFQMYTVLIFIRLGKSKIDEIQLVGITVPYEYIFQFEIIMYTSNLMKLSESLDLYAIMKIDGLTI